MGHSTEEPEGHLVAALSGEQEDIRPERIPGLGKDLRAGPSRKTTTC